MFQSHDGGDTFDTEKIVDSERYFFAGAGWANDDGLVVFAQTSYNQNYSGTIDVFAVVSTDSGATWDPVLVDTVRKQPDCTSRGCYDGYYASVPAIAMDDDGTLVMAFVGPVVREGRQRQFVRSSTDSGQTWSPRLRLSPKRANAISPAAAGTGSGDIRLWWMDTRTGRLNVWFRRSLDGGLTWGPAKRLSDAISGAVYKNRRGFQEAYGDHGEITIASDGATLAIWGEASSYYGPGGSWLNRSP
ncbi:MAG: sialidase family protein [Actinomycetota bacterium]